MTFEKFTKELAKMIENLLAEKHLWITKIETKGFNITPIGKNKSEYILKGLIIDCEYVGE